MPFDQPTRNRLAKFVGDARTLLSEEFTRQLQNEYGLDPASGEATDLERLTGLDDARRETARLLRETMDYYLAALTPGPSPASRKREQAKTVLERIVREQAFTVFNRLCALRMAEGRGLLIESVGRGYQSKGFQLYARLAGPALGETGEAYRSYLYSIFDEFALDLPALFDRFSPQGRLFPREAALLKLLDLINDPEIDQLWTEDETIGWIYQYFNSIEERKQMRAESSAPRNSRELAVRNQFFTPRYVVEFLTDNTLGRIWYEMTQGQTRLKESCRYLVRRPEEVFLAEAATAGAERAWDGSLEAAEWLLKGDEETFSPFDVDERSRQRLIQLASVVDGYRRYPKPAEWERWELVRIHQAIQQQDDLSSYSLQELLDVMFFMYRSDHWAGGEFLNDSREMRLMARLGNEVRRRVLAGWGEDLSQEELLRAPVFIPYRPLKDPREIKMLDPACGSMHFGLYAFDLFEQIYSEAWELEETLGEEALWRIADLDSLHDTYPDKEALLRDVPRLIIERNIHGIDIDPRAVQIAGLSLWLRAQKSWQAQGLRPAERPQIRKSNVVCAEPMPGNRKMLEEFLATLQEDRLEALVRKVLNVPVRQKVRITKAMADALANLVRTIWQEMELAGEAGSLLKIEETLNEAIVQARKASAEKAPLFRVLEYGMEYRSKEHKNQSSAAEDSDFWDHADTLVLGALQEYAEQLENGRGYRRRLFVGDAVQGFAFIGLCRRRYEAILMNPPFGEVVPDTKKILSEKYSVRTLDIGMAFVERAESVITANGRVGALTNRNFVANDTLDKWRKQYLLGHKCHLNLMLDLGFGVLDDALVEVAAYIISKASNEKHEATFFSLLEVINKQSEFEEYFKAPKLTSTAKIFTIPLETFVKLPNNVLCYWLPKPVLTNISEKSGVIKMGGQSRRGPDTGDDFRFLAAYWEVPIDNIGIGKKWVPYAKGGEYAPFYDDVHLVLMWEKDGLEIINFYDEEGNLRSRPQGREYLFRSGLTYPRRTTSDFSPRLLQEGTAFGGAGQSLFFDNKLNEIGYLIGAYTRTFKMIVEAFVGSGDTAFSGSAAKLYRTGLIESLPHPLTSLPENMIDDATLIICKAISLFDGDETTRRFTAPRILFNGTPLSLRDGFWTAFEWRIQTLQQIIEGLKVFDDYVSTMSFGLNKQDDINHLAGYYPTEYPKNKAYSSEVAKLYLLDEDSIKRIAVKKYGGRRQLTKKAFFADRKLELICHTLELDLASVIQIIIENKISDPSDLENGVKELLLWIIGCVYGRWNYHITFRNEFKVKPFIDLFSPLPICPPGMLQNARGLPAAPQDIPADYPLRIYWSGILIDDEGHPEDVATRVREALRVIWSERAESIEAEACQILGVRNLREYFQKPSLFFADHLKRYSKSRRQAPIYWSLSTPSCSYTLWLYYHRLSDQTLFTCVNDFVDPKLKQVSEEIADLRQRRNRSAAEEKELERLTDFERELKDFRAELLRVAAFWKPDLNDGVQITAAPLWKLFQHKPWQKKLKETWEKLERGDYDWAHLAYSIWPERVREKCRTDKSLAIAHDLEDLYEEPKASPKKKKAKKQAEEEMDELFDEE
jgi:hypothetical protein